MRVVRKEDINSPINNPSGEVIYEMFGRSPENGGATNHSLAYVVISPGKSSEAHYHKTSEETYYLLKGTGLMVVENQQFRIQPGQACLINPFEIHQIFNDGEDDLEFLAVSAPAWISSDSFSIPTESI